VLTNSTICLTYCFVWSLLSSWSHSIPLLTGSNTQVYTYHPVNYGLWLSHWLCPLIHWHFQLVWCLCCWVCLWSWFSLSLVGHVLVCFLVVSFVGYWISYVSSGFSDSVCRVATLLNTLTDSLLEDLLAPSLTFPQTLVFCSSSSSPKHLWREVLCAYPAVKGAGYQAVKGVHAGMWSSTLSTKAHTTKKTSFYISTSCRFGLTDQSEIRKVQG